MLEKIKSTIENTKENVKNRIAEKVMVGISMAIMNFSLMPIYSCMPAKLSRSERKNGRKKMKNAFKEAYHYAIYEGKEEDSDAVSLTIAKIVADGMDDLFFE